jgi:hypothetical protein
MNLSCYSYQNQVLDASVWGCLFVHLRDILFNYLILATVR